MIPSGKTQFPSFLRTRPSMSHTNGISELGPQYMESPNWERSNAFRSSALLLWFLIPSKLEANHPKNTQIRLSCAWIPLTSEVLPDPALRCPGSMEALKPQQVLHERMCQSRESIHQANSINHRNSGLGILRTFPTWSDGTAFTHTVSLPIFETHFGRILPYNNLAKSTSPKSDPNLPSPKSPTSFSAAPELQQEIHQHIIPRHLGIITSEICAGGNTPFGMGFPCVSRPPWSNIPRRNAGASHVMKLREATKVLHQSRLEGGGILLMVQKSQTTTERMVLKPDE